MTEDAPLTALRARSVLSELDEHFALALARLGQESDERVALAAALVSRQVQAGHVCLDLPALCRGELVLESEEGPLAWSWPELEAWCGALRASRLVGTELAATPLYLDTARRLYLRRYLGYERALARALVTRAQAPAPELDRKVLRDGLARLFSSYAQPSPTQPLAKGQLALWFASEEPARDAEPDEQGLAAERALERKLCVISGGPGTGKTSMVVKILALLVEQARARGEDLPRALLLAPTGKAAQRLKEAVAHAKDGLPCTGAVRAAIPEQASTIHRALGVLGGRRGFRHDRDNPLLADIVVVDEASMVDLALMAKLLEAMPESARVILLGDKDQLASVEAGAVLGDLCSSEATTIAPCIVELARSYRYSEQSGIRKLAEAINRGDAAATLAVLDDRSLPDVSLVALAPEARLPSSLLEAAVAGLGPFLDAADPEAKLRALSGFRVLCAHRRGSFGQVAVNQWIETRLRETGRVRGTRAHYAGRPILVTQNDTEARLFNGDVGVLAFDEEAPDRLRAYFLDASGARRGLSPARLPEHESVYAMSVHKSQGSEFEEVVVLLPSVPSPVLCRELLYTAVTRARQRVVMYGNPKVIAEAVGRTAARASGLRDALGGDSLATTV